MSTVALTHHLEPLQPFLKQAGVTEICINRPQELFVECNRKFTRIPMPVLTFEYLEALVELVAEHRHLEISKEHPLLSTDLPDGQRIQCVIPPACEIGKVIISIRCHQMQDLRLEDYEKTNAFALLNPSKTTKDNKLKHLYEQGQWVEFIKAAIIKKKNIIISGGTGTGKTTFLNSFLKQIDLEERLITIEDAREVNLIQPNCVHLIAPKQKNSPITMLDLFEACLRLRPDRIFLVELRGKEVFPFLRAANSGHPGSMTTVHADTPQACFEQLVFMMQQAGSRSNDERILAYVKSIIPIVIQIQRSNNPNQFMHISEIYYDDQS